MSEYPYNPLQTFRFSVSFTPAPLNADTNGIGGGSDSLPDAAFAECSGLEATMEPKVIKAGGNNYGAAQRVGPVTFGTVVLKRGISLGGKLFKWFERVTGEDPGYRATVRVTLLAPPSSRAGANAEDALVFRLERAMPIKFKAADFNAKATDVGIEELHLAHEGLFLEIPGSKGSIL